MGTHKSTAFRSEFGLQYEELGGYFEKYRALMTIFDFSDKKKQMMTAKIFKIASKILTV